MHRKKFKKDWKEMKLPCDWGYQLLIIFIFL